MPPKVSLGFACVSHRNRLWVLFPEWIPRVTNEDLQRRFEFPGDWTCRHLNDPNHPKSFKLLLHALPFKVWDTSSTRIWSCIWRLLSCTWIHHMDTGYMADPKKGLGKHQLRVAFEHVVISILAWVRLDCTCFVFEVLSPLQQTMKRPAWLETNNRAGCILCKFLRSHNRHRLAVSHSLSTGSTLDTSRPWPSTATAKDDVTHSYAACDTDDAKCSQLVIINQLIKFSSLKFIDVFVCFELSNAARCSNDSGVWQSCRTDALSLLGLVLRGWLLEHDRMCCDPLRSFVIPCSICSRRFRSTARFTMRW